MTNIGRYRIEAPRTPGGKPVIVGYYLTLPEARREARAIVRAWRGMRLRGQDVRIERRDGMLVEYAGGAS